MFILQRRKQNQAEKVTSLTLSSYQVPELGFKLRHCGSVSPVFILLPLQTQVGPEPIIPGLEY